MQDQGGRTFLWLIIGAIGGAACVFIINAVAGLPLPGFVGALVPTLSAVVFGGIGPKLGQPTDKDKGGGTAVEA